NCDALDGGYTLTSDQLAALAASGIIGLNGENLRPLMTASDYYTLTPASGDYVNYIGSTVSAENPRPGGAKSNIKVWDRTGSETYGEIHFNLGRNVVAQDRLVLWVWQHPGMRTYRNGGSFAASYNLTLSPDNVTATPTNKKTIVLPPDVWHPGWNELVISSSGNASVNRNDFAVAGAVVDPMPIRYVEMAVSFNGSTPQAERVAYVEGLFDQSPAQDFQKPILIFNAEQWGHSVVANNQNVQLLDYIESVGAQGYITGRALNGVVAPTQAAIVAARSASGWDVGHQAAGIAGVDTNWYTYDGAYPTEVERLTAFQSSVVSAEAALSAIGVTPCPLFSWPQGGNFNAGNQWLLGTKGYKAIRFPAQRHGHMRRQDATQYVHSLDLGSNGTATTFANTYSAKLKALVQLGGILNVYWHDIVRDVDTPDGSSLQQRYGEVKKLVDAAVALRDAGLLVIGAPRKVLPS
ncbi:MAG: hypothetical protein EBV73_06835, partial [Rhodocyclales bacterium]|nr:hypothetical protein [Rhodocyclales bacterium]